MHERAFLPDIGLKIGYDIAYDHDVLKINNGKEWREYLLLRIPAEGKDRERFQKSLQAHFAEMRG